MSSRHWLADLRRCGLTCHFDSSGSSDHSESSTAAAREREREVILYRSLTTCTSTSHRMPYLIGDITVAVLLRYV